MQITRTHNGHHLGDNLVHLHFLRKVALANPGRQFVHASQWQYIIQLKDVVADVPNIKLEEYSYRTGADSINSWRGDNQFWYSHPDKLDFVKFHVEAWFPYLADRMKVENPIKHPKDVLFDYPAIKKSLTIVGDVSFDVLVVNSPPGSGQWSNYNEFALAGIAKRLHQKGCNVWVTHPIPDAPSEYPNFLTTKNMSVSQIGNLSLHCHTILMVSTGPSWPTFNIWNQDTVLNRIILLDSERVNLSPHTIHCSRIEEAEEVLKESGLL